MKGVQPLLSTRIEKNKLVSQLDGIHSGEPFVTFTINEEGDYPYCIGIVAFIPSSVKEFTVSDPGKRKKRGTPAGKLETRLIKIKWEDNITPQEGPHDLWHMILWYRASKRFDKEGAFKVVYEFGDPKTTRGTVTTTGSST
ncbi:MAG: hypothetical protein AAGC45_05595 [Bacteroidota bacterium]